MNLIDNCPDILKVIISSSIFFVWIIRYDNIIKEFKEFNYPDWLRDLVGILKISFAIMILHSQSHYILFGSAGIMIFMLAAVLTHLKIKNSLHKMLPSLTLFCLSLYVFLSFNN